MRLINSMIRFVVATVKNKLFQDNRILIFLVFLLLSFGFWFLNALRRTYVSTVQCPITFVNLPPKKMMSGSVPYEIDLKVRGTGFALLRNQLSNQFIPFVIDVAKMRRLYDGTQKGAYMLTRDYTNRISAQLSNDVELVEMSPDTLYLNFFNKKSRLIPIEFDGTLNFIQQHNQIGKVSFSPESILVSGPEYIIDTLRSIRTEFMSFDKVKDTISSTVILAEMPELEFSQTEVAMSVPVDAFTELAVEVPIILRGVPENFTLKTFPAEVVVTFRVGISQFEKIKSQNFSAVVDVEGVDLATQNRLKVKLEQAPEFVYTVDYAPLFVDYLLERSN